MNERKICACCGNDMQKEAYLTVLYWRCPTPLHGCVVVEIEWPYGDGGVSKSKLEDDGFKVES